MTFHSVRKSHTEELGPSGELTLPDDVFEKVIRDLKVAGYNSINCQELFAHLSSGKPLPSKPVLLSFDDGYLDNWTIAAPILRRHGMRGVVFIATNFIDPSEQVRQTSSQQDNPPERGYLNAAELRSLDQEGVLEVQSHTAGHSQVATSNNVIDYHRPEKRNQWLERNAATNEQLAQEHSGATNIVAWGTPVFEQHWSSPATAFLHQAELSEELQAWVTSQGGEQFFQRSDWRAQLDAIVARVGVVGQQESAEAQRQRILTDLVKSKACLEEILGHTVPFLAWPGGGSSKLAVDLAIDKAGYLATFGTNRKNPGVAQDIRAIPRAYFRQNYRGKNDLELRAALCKSIIDWESGKLSGYFQGFITRRRMRLDGDTSFPNKPQRN